MRPNWNKMVELSIHPSYRYEIPNLNEEASRMGFLFNESPSISGSIDLKKRKEVVLWLKNGMWLEPILRHATVMSLAPVSS